MNTLRSSQGARFLACAALVLLALVSAAGCTDSGAGIEIEIGFGPDGSVEERIAVHGVDAAVDVPGWSRESSETAEYSRTFDDPSALPLEESKLVGALLRAVSADLGYVPVILDQSKIDVTVENYLLFKTVDVAYRLPEIDFRPLHCLECEGEGRHACTACDTAGSLTCPTCEGEGAHECEECGADGSHECESCTGTGYRECYSCDGSGSRTCYGCSGSGTDFWGDTCYSCDGSGSLDCATCDSSGKIGCYSCDETGKIECYSCDGEGRVECVECQGFTTIACEACDGQGALVCVPCNGDGSPTPADFATYESALGDASIDLAIDMPGFVSKDTKTQWHLSGDDTIMPDDMRVSSKVPNWPIALGSGGGVLAISLLAVALSVRGIRRRSRAKASAVPAPGLPVPLACVKCGNPMKASSAFCTECGTRR